MASVRKRKWIHNGTPKEAWVTSYTDQNGKRRIKTFDKKKDADGFRQKVEAEIEGGFHVPAAETKKFGEAIDLWLKDCWRRREIGNMAGNTVRGYEAKAKHLKGALGGVLLTAVTPGMLQDFIDDAACTMSRSSCKAIVIVASQTFYFAVRRKWLKRNPLLDEPVSVPASASKRRVTAPGQEQIAAVFRALAERRPFEHEHTRAQRIAFFTLAVFTGMRRGEIFGLQWGDIDFPGQAINVQHSLSRADGLKGPKTKAGYRRIPLADQALRVLLMLRDRLGDEPAAGFVFTTKSGAPIVNDHPFIQAWRELLKAAGLVDEAGKPLFTPHSLRHAAASLLIAQGLDAFQLKFVIGHASVSTTMDVYGHLLPENQNARDAVSTISGRFGDIMALAPVEIRARPVGQEAWLEARVEALDMIADGVSAKEVAERLSVSLGVIYSWMKDAGTGTPMAIATQRVPFARQGCDKALKA